MPSIHDEIRKKLDKPNAWKPEEPGDHVIGKVIDVTMHDGTHGEYRRVELETETGEIVPVNGFGLLAEPFEKIERGDHVGVMFHGEKRNQADTRTYKDFKCVVEKAADSGSPLEPPPEAEDEYSGGPY